MFSSISSLLTLAGFVAENVMCQL